MVKSNKILLIFLGTLALVLTLLYVRMHKAQEQVSNELHVWAYGSFYSDYGPGQLLVSIFEKQTGVRVVFDRIEEPGLFLKHLDFIPNQPVDVVVNFDQWNISEAIDKLNPIELEASGVPWRPEVQDFVGERVKPFDWAPMTWIYRKGSTPPKDWDDFFNFSKIQK